MMNLLEALWGTAGLVYPEPTWRDALSRWKYCIRGLITPRLTAEWFSLLSSRHLEPLVRQHPYSFSKLQRPFLHRRLTTRGGLALLKNHYQFVAERLGSKIFEEIVTPPGFLLAALPVPEPGRFSLRLSYPIYPKEGELSLGLLDKEWGMPLFTLTFCVSRFGHEEPGELFIGGLQGSKAPNQRELVIRLTRSLHGIRPKALLVFALQQLAQFWGIPNLRAVGDREHIYRHYRKRRSIRASYDEFWLECQGQPLPDGNFQLPVGSPPRNLEEAPRKKRPIYRRRYVMLAHLAQEIERRMRQGRLPAQH